MEIIKVYKANKDDYMTTLDALELPEDIKRSIKRRYTFWYYALAPLGFVVYVVTELFYHIKWFRK